MRNPSGRQIPRGQLVNWLFVFQAVQQGIVEFVLHQTQHCLSLAKSEIESQIQRRLSSDLAQALQATKKARSPHKAGNGLSGQRFRMFRNPDAPHAL